MSIDHYVGAGSIGIVIEYCITGFGYVNSKSVGLAVSYGGVDGLSDTSEGSGEVADFISELDGWDREVVKFRGGCSLV